MRTQVAIIGAGPAGLLLSHLLHLRGIGSIVLERHDRGYVENRIRAGVMEHDVAALLDAAGVGARMRREGLVHGGINLRFRGRLHRVDFRDLVGRTVMVYGQQEVVKDLIAARLDAGGTILFEAEATAIEGIDGERPQVRFRKDGEEHVLACDFVAGCDGFHGVSRAAVPASRITLYERVYPFAWLGILAEAPPASEELVYAHHERGFALLSMRSPSLSRLYVQCRPDERLEDWPDARVWEELDLRLGGEELGLVRGPVLQKGITAMRSFVAEPMRFGRLFLAGDAAHIVPPTGAKGMNLAVADVRLLDRALGLWYGEGDGRLLDSYSAIRLRHIWRVQHFSWWMTAMLHRFEDASPFDRRRQLAELDHLVSSPAARRMLAESYTGLPFLGEGELAPEERS